MTNKKSIFKSVAVVTAFSVATRLFAFLFKVFVSRQFGASVVGVYQMALSFYFFASAVALSGLPTVISRKITEDEKTGGENVPSLISTALVLSLSSVLPILSIIYPVAFLLPSVFADERVLPLVVIMLPALLSTSIYNVIRSWFWGKRSFLAFSFTEMLEEAVTKFAASKNEQALFLLNLHKDGKKYGVHFDNYDVTPSSNGTRLFEIGRAHV